MLYYFLPFIVLYVAYGLFVTDKYLMRDKFKILHWSNADDWAAKYKSHRCLSLNEHKKELLLSGPFLFLTMRSNKRLIRWFGVLLTILTAPITFITYHMVDMIFHMSRIIVSKIFDTLKSVYTRA